MLTSQCHMISKPQKSHCHIVVTYYTFLSQVLLNCGGKSWWILVGKTHKTHGPRTLVQGQICCRKPMYINQFQLHSGNQTWRTLGKSPISRWFSQLDTSMCKWGFPEMGEPPARWFISGNIPWNGWWLGGTPSWRNGNHQMASASDCRPRLSRKKTSRLSIG